MVGIFQFQGAPTPAPPADEVIPPIVPGVEGDEFNGHMIPSAKDFLQLGINTGNQQEMDRRFKKVCFSGAWKMSEVVATLEDFLKQPTAIVSFLTARSLIVVGDEKEGFDPLYLLVQAKDPIPGVTTDLRVEAADVLVKYRQSKGATAIGSLYQSIGDINRLRTLYHVFPQRMIEKLYEDSLDEQTTAAVLRTGITHHRDYPTQGIILKLWGTTSDPKMKASCAIASVLLHLDSEPEAVKLIDDTARSWLFQPGKFDVKIERTLLKVLGNCGGPDSKQTLEDALDSQDPEIVQIAIVNLLFNRGGSDKAVQIIIHELSEPEKAKLPRNFTVTIASQLLDQNPLISLAGNKFAVTYPMEWTTAVDRKEWPIYGWIDSYVLEVNGVDGNF
jgi:hypothetical protein